MSAPTKMEIALRRNEQARGGSSFVAKIKEAVPGDPQIDLIPVEETFRLEQKVRGFGTEARSKRELGLSWHEALRKIEEWCGDASGSTCSILLCTAPSLSFVCSRANVGVLLALALDEDGDTVCVLRNGEPLEGVAIDRYSESGDETVYELDWLRTTESTPNDGGC